MSMKYISLYVEGFAQACIDYGIIAGRIMALEDKDVAIPQELLDYRAEYDRILEESRQELLDAIQSAP